MKRRFYFSILITAIALLLPMRWLKAQSVTFNYTGAVQTYTVAAGVTTLSVDMAGAQGGNGYSNFSSGGLGGRVQCTMNVTPGQVLYIYVGGAGAVGVGSGNAAAGYNGGGVGGPYGGGGGGASDIRTDNGSITATNRLVVAGGGGGGAWDCDGDTGGAGGGLTGGIGIDCGSNNLETVGSGGTQLAGGVGATDGAPAGTLGQGASYANGTWGSAGGGGYYGGGAGWFGSGGGGSSFTNPTYVTAVVHTQGYAGAGGNAYVTLTEAPSCTTPSITSTVNSVCVGSTISLTATPTGGTWTSSNATVSVDGTAGAVSGVSEGTASVTYSVTGGCSVATTITIGAIPTISVNAIPAICQGTTSAVLSYSNQIPFAFTGGMQTWTVPGGVDTLNFDLSGARGGYRYDGPGTPGHGGRVQGKLGVTPGEVLNIFVGGVGAIGSASGAAGGYNGGGQSYNYGGGGGGATDIRVGGTALENRIIIAGAGGGGGADGGNINGGNGGGLTGSNGGPNPNVGTTPAGGGTQVAGGAGAYYPGWGTGSNGALAVGGAGLNDPGSTYSAGGGGGYYGGGGGVWSGGGGGSSYTDASLTNEVVHTQGYNNAPGYAVLSYDYPAGTTYTITWDAAAHTAGFTDITATLLPASPITLAVPAGVNASTYTASFSINTGICSSTPQTISVTVNRQPGPISGDTVLCYAGTYSLTDDSTGGVWSSSSAAIADIDPTSGSVTAMGVGNTMITYTLLDGGCFSTANVTVNALPTLTLGSDPEVCPGTPTAYLPYSGLGHATAGSSMYNVTWDGTALAAGFTNAVDSIIPVDGFTMDVPVTAPGGMYGAILTLQSELGCTNGYLFNVVVKDTAYLTSARSLVVCDNTLLDYAATASLPGTAFSWSRAAVTGISNAAAAGTTDEIMETLHNTTHAPVVVTYIDTLFNNGCYNVDTILVTVNPTPVLDTTGAPALVCNNTVYATHFSGPVAATAYTWSRAAVAGISNPAASGAGNVSETLVNTTSAPVAVVYVDTLMANGCQAIYTDTVTVDPTLLLSSTLNPAAVCDSVLMSYVPTSLTAGVSFAWSRAAVTGISNTAATGTADPAEVLVNTTADPQTVTYVYTLSVDGCTNTQNVDLTVNPKPVLSNTITPLTTCDSAIFSFAPASATAGTAFAWSRAFVLGISNAAAAGTNNPAEYLNNTSAYNVNVIYLYTLTANGCSNTQNVVVTVRPTPVLNTSTSYALCSGAPFNYVPGSLTPLVTYAWSRAITSITPGPGAKTGTDNINDTLFNTTSAPVAVAYNYTLTLGTCTNSEAVVVLVNPNPSPAAITTMPSASVCANTQYANFGTATPAASGYAYHWSATNATVEGVGAGGQYALVNFADSGTAVVTVTTSNTLSGCNSSSSYSVAITGTASDVPNVVYTRGQLVCFENNVDSYQWGYDDASTLDSTIIPGAIDQTYSIDISASDFAGKYYWVITHQTGTGCYKKAYYNLNLSVQPAVIEASVKLYPNPANDVVNVEISNAGDNTTVEVIDMMGRKVSSTLAMNGKAQININGLSAGYYVVNCVREGVKIASGKFIKN